MAPNDDGRVEGPFLAETVSLRPFLFSLFETDEQFPFYLFVFPFVFRKHGSVDDIDEGENILYYKARDYTPKELPPVRMIPGAHKPMKPPLTEFQKWMLSICGHSVLEEEEC